MAAEMVELVDEEGRPQGQADKRLVHGADTPLHRGFSVFLFDPGGRTLLQQRAASKRTWPGVWSNGCCGHPAPGEAVEEAARRRIRYELGVEVRDLQVFLPRYRYRFERDGVVENEVCPVLGGRVGGDLHPHPEEVAAVRWTAWEDLVGEIAGDHAYSPWCAEEVRLLARLPAFAEWRRRG